MGGNYPMPTILSKGELILRLDRQYENAQRRLDGLRRLVVQDLDIVMSGQSGETPSGAKLVDAGEAKHMNDDWFGADGSNWWNVLQPLGFFPGLWVNGTLTNDQLLQARQTLKLGFIRALAVSLGLTESVLDAPGDIPETTGGLEADKIRPLKVYWICGKLDGIEAQVVETKHQVDFFIITPPIKFGVDGLCYTFNEDEVNHLNKAEESMVLVRWDTALGAPTVRHVGLEDGGIAEGGTDSCTASAWQINRPEIHVNLERMVELPEDSCVTQAPGAHGSRQSYRCRRYPPCHGA